MAAASTNYRSPTFTQLVVGAMRKHFPEEIAERSWDNVGLLFGNIETSPDERKPPVVLVTNDLTYAVAQEAVEKGASVVVSYHPIIFSGLKSITTNDPQQATLLLLASRGVAVYCPHTALDAAPRGINAWLADSLAGDAPFERTAATPNPAPLAGFEGAGSGGVLRFSTPQKAGRLVSNLAAAIGMQHVMVAAPDRQGWREREVSSAAVCAGSGWGVVKDADADVIVTGEVSHHNALQAVQLGKIVVTVFHSNSERGFLRERLVPLLEGELRETEPGAKVFMSQVDRDPFEIVQA
ncbi:NGG1p interacting factor 3 [Sodiomyces alkalinus F11]|uniref:NGG1p interacting factor 3 n=1 Tax=Sodiomyces alkalinus (strain CBS 110278 / VKM F-3762 / F11) TaxID=1314773 RepID=A0A3N2PUE9_SODAK|nr:NGG1p interacting factor 3 [Sodiomyces alkalinus F11]ROT37946.1 NGG1p interacting factor 3 [Sodiomyces alkalinus F11]